MGKPSLKITSDFTKQFTDIVDLCRDQEVVVGIPEEDAAREPSDDEPREINNAFLLYINENGSPANNIPERPVMKNGLAKASEDIADQFHLAAKNAFNGGQKSLDKYLNRAGIIASSSIKNAIDDQLGIDSPAESTLRARKAKGFKGTKALIETGQMRNAITHVVRNKKLWRK